MQDRHLDPAPADQEQWLKLYYFIRAAFSVAWVVAAFTVGQSAVIAGNSTVCGKPKANFIAASLS